MTDTTTHTGYVCRKCEAEVAQGTKRCGDCGYAGRTSRLYYHMMASCFVFFKWFCYVTIVGIPVGLAVRRVEHWAKALRACVVAQPVHEEDTPWLSSAADVDVATTSQQHRTGGDPHPTGCHCTNCRTGSGVGDD